MFIEFFFPSRDFLEESPGESLGELRGDSGTPRGVDGYNQGLSRKPLLESPEKFKFLKILEELPGSFRKFLKYATHQGVPGDFVGESRLGSNCRIDFFI
jgi:hypothetical protein